MKEWKKKYKMIMTPTKKPKQKRNDVGKVRGTYKKREEKKGIRVNKKLNLPRI